MRWRIRYSGGRRTVIGRAFDETEDLVAGYALVEVKSREEAMEWASRFPNPAIDGERGEIEVRELFVDDLDQGEAEELLGERRSRGRSGRAGATSPAAPCG